MANIENKSDGKSNQYNSVVVGERNDKLPKKSEQKYKFHYNCFMKWRAENGKDDFTEETVASYFKDLSEKNLPSTVFCVYSMIRSVLNVNHNIDIGRFSTVKAFLKKNAEKFEPKSAKRLTGQQILRFVETAPDDFYLDVKVVALFSIYGKIRCTHLTNVTLKHVLKEGNVYLVHIPQVNSKPPNNFVIAASHSWLIDKYLGKRPIDIENNRFFISFKEGKCFKTPIGVHKFADMPRKIAKFLKLPNPETYTGLSLRNFSRGELQSIVGDSADNINSLLYETSSFMNKTVVTYSQAAKLIQNKGGMSNLEPSSTPSSTDLIQLPSEPITHFVLINNGTGSIINNLNNDNILFNSQSNSPSIETCCDTNETTVSEVEVKDEIKSELIEDFDACEVKQEPGEELAIMQEIVFCDEQNAEATDDFSNLTGHDSEVLHNPSKRRKRNEFENCTPMDNVVPQVINQPTTDPKTKQNQNTCNCSASQELQILKQCTRELANSVEKLTEHTKTEFQRQGQVMQSLDENMKSIKRLLENSGLFTENVSVTTDHSSVNVEIPESHALEEVPRIVVRTDLAQ